MAADALWVQEHHLPSASSAAGASSHGRLSAVEERKLSKAIQLSRRIEKAAAEYAARHGRPPTALQVGRFPRAGVLVEQEASALGKFVALFVLLGQCPPCLAAWLALQGTTCLIQKFGQWEAS